MPFINGKFYVNPAYGRAIEKARANEPTDGDRGGHWVTIDRRKDWVIRAGPSASLPGKCADLKDYVNSHPITVTSTQTLTVAAADASYEVTWTRTLTNVCADGKLNTKTNSHGVNFTVTWTSPKIKGVSR